MTITTKNSFRTEIVHTKSDIQRTTPITRRRRLIPGGGRLNLAFIRFLSKIAIKQPKYGIQFNMKT